MRPAVLGLSFTIGQLPDCRRQPEPEFTKRHWGLSASASMERIAPSGRSADANPAPGLGRALSGAQPMRSGEGHTRRRGHQAGRKPEPEQDEPTSHRGRGTAGCGGRPQAAQREREPPAPTPQAGRTAPRRKHATMAAPAQSRRETAEPSDPRQPARPATPEPRASRPAGHTGDDGAGGRRARETQADDKHALIGPIGNGAENPATIPIRVRPGGRPGRARGTAGQRQANHGGDQHRRPGSPLLGNGYLKPRPDGTTRRGSDQKIESDARR